MEGRLMFFFDKGGDVLDISIGKPRKAISKEMGNDIVVRTDPKTREIVGFTILNFERRFEELKKDEEISVPLKMRITA